MGEGLKRAAAWAAETRKPNESMVERVARAICALDPMVSCVMHEHPEREPCTEANCVRFRQARAAIATMREPTEGMCEVGMAADLAFEATAKGAMTDHAETMWTAMIDAALGDSNE